MKTIKSIEKIWNEASPDERAEMIAEYDDAFGKQLDNGCIEYDGRTRKGMGDPTRSDDSEHGTIDSPARPLYHHRFGYFLRNGPIGKDMLVVPKESCELESHGEICANPQHKEAITVEEKNRRSRDNGAFLDSSHKQKLTRAQAQEVYDTAHLFPEKSNSTIVEELNLPVKSGCVTHIKHGHTWEDIDRWADDLSTEELQRLREHADTSPTRQMTLDEVSPSDEPQTAENVNALLSEWLTLTAKLFYALTRSNASDIELPWGE